MVFAAMVPVSATKDSTVTTVSCSTARTDAMVMVCVSMASVCVMPSSLPMIARRSGLISAPSQPLVSTALMCFVPTIALAMVSARMVAACAPRVQVLIVVSHSVLVSPCAQIMVSVRT